MSGRYGLVYGSGLVRPDGTTHSCLSTGGVCSCILTELNTLLDRAEKAEARVAELRTILDEATDRSDLHFNNLSRTLANQRDEKQAHALTVAKLQARVAELEREEMKVIDAWRAKQAAASTCPKCGAGFVLHDWTLDPNPKLIRRRCSCGWDSGPVGRFTVTEVDDGAKTVTISSEPITKPAPQTPVPAPEGTETVQKAPPPSPVGAPGSDPGSDSAGQVGNRSPVLGHPRASESSNLDMAYPTEEPSGQKVPDRIAWFATPEADAFRVYDEMLRHPGHPQRGLTPEEVDLTKPQTLRAYTTFGEASPQNSIRITVDPAAAAEVEARTGAYVMQSGGVVTISAIDGVIVEVRHPRAGLPSRDEVAAFLEARWPK